MQNTPYYSGSKRSQLDEVENPQPQKRMKPLEESTTDVSFLEGLPATPYLGASYSQVTTEVLEKEDKDE